jgi:hypothetical protein
VQHVTGCQSTILLVVEQVTSAVWSTWWWPYWSKRIEWGDVMWCGENRFQQVRLKEWYICGSWNRHFVITWTLWDLRFSRWWLRRESSGMLRPAALVKRDVSEWLSSSIIRMTRIGELGTLSVTSNRRTLKMEAQSSSETSVLTRTTRCNIPEDGTLHVNSIFTEVFSWLFLPILLWDARCKRFRATDLKYSPEIHRGVKGVTTSRSSAVTALESRWVSSYR